MCTLMCYFKQIFVLLILSFRVVAVLCLFLCIPQFDFFIMTTDNRLSVVRGVLCLAIVLYFSVKRKLRLKEAKCLACTYNIVLSQDRTLRPTSAPYASDVFCFLFL